MSRYAAVNVRFGADISQFSTAMQNAARQMQRAGDQLQNVGKSMSMNLTAPILALGTASLYAFGKIDMLKRGLTTFMGTTEAAEAEFSKLREVAKLPGIGLEEAVRGANNLMAIGMSADEARKAMMSFGNAIATVGGGREMFDLAIRGFGQLSNAAKPLQQDLYQIANQLPQVNKLMKEAFGTNRAEDLAAMGITGKQLADFLVNELGKLPPVTGGIANAFENMADTSKVALASFGEAIEKNFDISGKLNKIGEMFTSLVEKFKNLSPATQGLILSIAGLAAAIGPLLFGIGAVVKILPVLMSGFTALTGPVGLALAAIGLLVSGIILFNNHNKQTAPIISEVDKAIMSETASAKALFAQLGNTNFEHKRRIELIDEINTKYGTHLKNMSDEGDFANQLAIAYSKVSDQLITKIRLQANEKELVDLIQKQIQLEKQLEAVQIKNNEDAKKGIAISGNRAYAIWQEIEALKVRQQLLLNKGVEISSQTESTKAVNPFTVKGKSQTDELGQDITLKWEELAKFNAQGYENFTNEFQANVDNGDLETVTTSLENRLEDMRVRTAKKLMEFKQSVVDIQNELKDTIKNGFTNMIVDSFATIGENSAMKQDPFENIGKNLKDSMGKLLATLGSAMISWGIAQMAFNVALGTLNPVGMIAAGAAMVAIGAGVSKAAQGGLKGAATSSGGNAGSYSGGNETLTLQTRLDGNDLYLSGQRTQLVRGR